MCLSRENKEESNREIGSDNRELDHTGLYRTFYRTVKDFYL